MFATFTFYKEIPSITLMELPGVSTIPLLLSPRQAILVYLYRPGATILVSPSCSTLLGFFRVIRWRSKWQSAKSSSISAAGITCLSPTCQCNSQTFLWHVQYQLTSADKGSRTGRCCRCPSSEEGLAEPKRQQGLFVPYFPSSSAKEMLDYCNDKSVTSKSFVQLVRSCFYLFTIQTCECHFKHLQDFWLPLRGNGSSTFRIFCLKENY